MMDKERFCQKESLVSTLDGTICRCRCGIYHVRIRATTLHLSASQFDGVARLFKLALGMVTSERSTTADVRVGSPRLLC